MTPDILTVLTTRKIAYHKASERMVKRMTKLESILDATKLNELLGKKEEKKKCNVVLWVLAIIGIVAAVAGIAYALCRYFKPDYLEDFEDEFEDMFEDEFEDEDEVFEDEKVTKE